ncbi:MAG TPA: NAD(P)H-dependent glycerol-3-phosphate dehydrogenase, partial [Rhizomicrobium sp.]
MAKSKNPSGAYQSVGILGAGAWGLALAIVAAKAGRRVSVWTRNKPAVTRVLSSGELPDAIALTTDRAAIAEADAILVAAPAQHTRKVLSGFNPAPGSPLVLCAKGIERGSGKLMTEVLADTIPDAEPAILSGPSFARDVVQGLPTAVTIAARASVAQRLQATLGHASFRPYASEDIIGVALGGAAKNVYAIACGIVIGLGLGESARAALIARSFAELSRFARALGARDETLTGLSGLGDLVLTATSPTSRNFSFGLGLGRGEPLAELATPGGDLAEGVETAPALVWRAGRAGVELPIAQTVVDILAGDIAPSHAAPRLMARPLKME